jgi:hypothetical protein
MKNRQKNTVYRLHLQARMIYGKKEKEVAVDTPSPALIRTQ